MQLGILGVPYCGSTLLGALLDQCPGVAAAGEVNALASAEGALSCNAHGPDCPVWTPECLLRPVPHPVTYAWRVLGRPSALVLSLKHPHLYDQFASLDAGIVLFRHPQANAYSSYRHEGTDPAAYHPVWAERYLAIMDWLKARGLRHVAVEYAALCASPDAVVAAIARALDFSAPEQRLELEDRNDHQLGGNVGLIGATRVEYDDRWRSALGLPEVPPEVMQLYRTLQEEAIS